MTDLWRLLAFLRPYRGLVIVTGLAASGIMVCTLILPYLTGRIIDDVLRHGERGELAPLLWAVFAVAVVRFGLGLVRRQISGHISLGVEYDMRDTVFSRVQRLSLAFFDHMPVGQLMSRATSDLQTVRFFLGYGLVFMFTTVFTLLMAAAWLITIDWQLAIFSLAVGPAVLAVATRFGQVANPLRIDLQQRLGEVSQAGEESVAGIRVIKAFGRERERSAAFERVANGAMNRGLDVARVEGVYEPVMGFLPTAGLAVILMLGGHQVMNGTLTLGQFVQFYLYLTLLMGPFRSLGFLVAGGQRALAGGRRIFEILDAETEVPEPAHPVPLPDGDGRVTFDHVHFAYGTGDAADPFGREVLQGVDLDIPGGRVVALIGATGSGKSTLTELIARYYDPTGGRVLLDGVDIRDLALDDLRRAVGMVSQEPFLFSTTVRENIAYGRPDATLDQVRAAARLAAADEFVEALPNGYDTVIGERGLTLSGGQRQRLAIARAVITDPRVLILDEATASVDASTERQIQDALRAVMAGRTTVIIAHRLSTIQLADEIVVLDRGVIAARGTHDELYGTSPLYREIHRTGLARPELVLGDS